MTEEKAVNKRVKARKVLRILARILFTLFLAALIFFQAPVKVIIFFFIFLLADLFIPKPYYKYFWLFVLAVFIGFAIWVFLPENDQGWEPFVFEDEIQAFNQKYAVPDEQNAALAYKQIFADVNKTDLDPNVTQEVEDITMRQPWTAQQYPELAKWLEQKQPFLDKIEKAAQKQGFYLEKKTDDFFNPMIDHLRMYRKVAYTLVRFFYLNVGQNNIDQAIENATVLKKMSRQIFLQPNLIFSLVGISLDALALNNFKYLLAKEPLDQDHIANVENILKDGHFDWNKIYSKAMENENLTNKNLHTVWIYETKNGSYRFSRSYEGLNKLVSNNDIQRFEVSYPKRKWIKAQTLLKWFFYPSDPHEFGKIIERIYIKNPSEVKFSLKTAKLNIEYQLKMMQSMLTTPMENISKLFQRLRNNFQGTLILLEMRKFKNVHSKWPQSLDQLALDGIDKSEFVYKKIDEDNFILYNIGINKIDEGGFREGGNIKMGKDDTLIWPAYEKELEKLISEE